MSNLNLSVIILSYNTKDITGRCLDKLKISKSYCEKRLGNKVEVMVLDNASSDGSVGFIKLEYPWVKLIISKENLGFGKGNNVCLRQSKYPYILLLNSDVYVEEESLYKALAYFRVNLNCDSLGARLNYANGELQPSCGNLPTPLNIFFWILGLSLIPFVRRFVISFHPRDRKFFSKAHQVGWVMGAFFMLKREIYSKVGGFDENLFMHMEEVEWCKRIKDQGYKIWYVPQVSVVHLHGASTNFDLSSSFLNELKGIKYYLIKHYRYFYFPIKLVLIIGLVLRIIAFSLFAKTKRAKIYMEGLRVI
ncbi:MAG: glycosyltransferase family 2 protein [Candidatus Daviesbacteria bacterium]|nr:glycosyltransferase family 2 protein [Candidatus Daviesbacteria bacterium]